MQNLVLNVEELKKFGMGLLVTVGDAGLVYVHDKIDGLDLGVYGALAKPVIKVVVNEVRKLLHGGVVAGM